MMEHSVYHLRCGDCKVLVDNFEDKYGTCSDYCASIGRTCGGAWEELSNTCDVEEEIACGDAYPTSDALCKCLEAPPSPPSACVSKCESVAALEYPTPERCSWCAQAWF